MAKGLKTGGREKGTPNKATSTREAKIAASGLTPLEFMLSILRDDEKALDDRKWAAQNAAPFVHPRLTSIKHSGDEDGAPITFQQIVRKIVDSDH